MPTMAPLAGHRVATWRTISRSRTWTTRIHSEDLRGKQVVHVVFWATLCVPCLQEVPTLRTIQEKYRDRGVQILGIVVDMNQTKDGVRAAARDMKINYRFCGTTGGEVQEALPGRVHSAEFLIG